MAKESYAVMLARIDGRLSNLEKGNEDILEQTKKTNGRVTRLELWRSRLGGIWFALFIVGTALGVIIGWFFK